jgi:preprotein translocase subunit SecA
MPHRYVAQVAKINALEPQLRALTDSQLAEQTLLFRERLQANTHRWGWCGCRQRLKGCFTLGRCLKECWEESCCGI